MSDVVNSAREVLAVKARSFRWAAAMLEPSVHDDVALLYAFCRAVDDYADEEADSVRAHELLDQIEAELDGEATPSPVIAAFIEMADRRGVDLRVAHELIEGVRSDIDGRVVETDEELLRYCYRVAGTVGLMMCSVLDVTDPRAFAHAIDLGIGMQLTNISRDVLEDSHNGRVYLPRERLRAHGVTPDQLLRGTVAREPIKRVVRELLAIADTYYRSADLGIRYIPSPSRRAIVAASHLYRAIGIKLVTFNGADALRGRTVVSAPEKIGWLTWAAGSYALMKARPQDVAHEHTLHEALQGLPGVAEF